MELTFYCEEIDGWIGTGYSRCKKKKKSKQGVGGEQVLVLVTYFGDSIWSGLITFFSRMHFKFCS